MLPISRSPEVPINVCGAVFSTTYDALHGPIIMSTRPGAAPKGRVEQSGDKMAGDKNGGRQTAVPEHHPQGLYQNPGATFHGHFSDLVARDDSCTQVSVFAADFYNTMIY